MLAVIPSIIFWVVIVRWEIDFQTLGAESRISIHLTPEQEAKVLTQADEIADRAKAMEAAGQWTDALSVRKQLVELLESSLTLDETTPQPTTLEGQ